MKISIRPLAVTAATALTFGLVGCSGAEEPATAPAPASSPSSSAPPTESSPAATSSSSTSPSASPSASSSPTARAEVNDALLAAGRRGLKEVSSGTVTSIESERTGWDVHVVTSGGQEQQLRIDKAGKRVVAGPTDDRADAEDRAENQQFARADVDYRAAVKAVEDEIEGSQINEISLDRDNGRTLWEADVTVDSQQRSVQVDADNGRVVSNRIDD